MKNRQERIEEIKRVKKLYCEHSFGSSPANIALEDSLVLIKELEEENKQLKQIAGILEEVDND